MQGAYQSHALPRWHKNCFKPLRDNMRRVIIGALMTLAFVSHEGFKPLFSDATKAPKPRRIRLSSKTDPHACAGLLSQVFVHGEQLAPEGSTHPLANDLRRLQMRLRSPETIERFGRKVGVPMSVSYTSMKPEDPTGDFYHMRSLPSGEIAFFIGDVMSHGINAAAVSLFLHKLIESESIRTKLNLNDIVGTLKTLDTKLDEYALQTTWGTYNLVTISMVLAILNPQTGEIRVSMTSGLAPLVIVSPDGSTRIINDPAPPLTISKENQDYSYSSPDFSPQSAITEQLQPGDMLVMMTDGIGDAKLNTGRVFQAALVKDKISLPYEPSPSQMVKKIRGMVSGIIDDATVFAFKWPGGDLQCPTGCVQEK